MKVKYGIKSGFFSAPTTVTIGEFDGFHLGHRKIIDRTVALASQTSTQPGAVTFEKQYPALSTSEEKLRMLKDRGLQLAVVLPLKGRWRDFSAEYFAGEFLIRQLNARNVVVGEDFKFGRRRSGSVKTLKSIEGETFKTHTIALEKKGGRKISSSRIKELLRAGQLQRCRQMLGRNYFFTGQVVSGKGLARSLGFPTLNFSVPAEKILPGGVFLCRALTGSEAQYGSHYGACFVGRGEGGAGKTAEIHFFNPPPPPEDIRGGELVEKISSVKKLSNREALIEKISSDVEKAKKILKEGNLT